MPREGVARLSADQIETAVLASGLQPLAEGVAEKFATFAGLLERWNAKLNLTALRSPEQILDRHFIECIFCAQNLPVAATLGSGDPTNPATLLDFGSGAGFPGIPIALCRPDIAVNLAESSGKKAAFLREATRTLGLKAEVLHGRVEDLSTDLQFDVVTMRAVDRMEEAIAAAAVRVRPGGLLTLMTTEAIELPGFGLVSRLRVPSSENGVVIQLTRLG